MPDSVFPLDSLHNLQIYFDVSVFPVTARFKVCFHQHSSISLPSKCEENLPVVCVRAGLGTGFVQVSGAGMATSGGGVELLSLCWQSLTGSLAKRMLCPFCMTITNGF